MYVNISNDGDLDQIMGQDMLSPIVRTDEERLMQILLNLQSNALKFTETGSVTIRVEISDNQADQFLVVSVIDTGIGIKEQD